MKPKLSRDNATPEAAEEISLSKQAGAKLAFDPLLNHDAWEHERKASAKPAQAVEKHLNRSKKTVVRDLGGTPGVDIPWPCEFFGRPCSVQLSKLDFHTCAAEPYAQRAKEFATRAYIAKLVARGPETGEAA